MKRLYAYVKTNMLQRMCASVLVACMLLALIPETSLSVCAETAVSSGNLAPTASVKTEADMEIDRLEVLNDDKDDKGIWRHFTTSGTTYELEDDYYTFTWNIPVTVAQVSMVVQKAKQQAPTAWSIEVSKDGTSSWKQVAYVADVAWTTDNEIDQTATESKEVNFGIQKNIKGLRIQVKKVNCAWKNGYAINDIKIFGEDALAKEGYILDWNEEFAQTELDSDKWLLEYLPHNTTSAEGAKTKYTMEHGILKLRIDQDSVDYYTGKTDRTDGGFMVSSIQTYEKNGLHMDDNKRAVEPFNGYATQYGYFELRCKMPSYEGGGVAAWWMVGTEYDSKKNGLDSKQNGEIDIMETFFSSPNTFSPKVHQWDDPDLQDWGGEQAVELQGNYSDQFHTYAMDWRPDYIAFYVDGQEVARTNQSPQYDMCMLLSLYTSKNPNYWGGGAAGDEYPKEWEIDYLRVYKDKNGYPDGVTKPTEREPSGLPIIESQLYTGSGNPTEELGITDLARTATLTSTAEHASTEHLKYLNSEDYNLQGGYQSKDNPTLPAEYTFTWDSPQNVDMLNLYSYFANSQAPTEIELQVQKAGGKWKKVAEYEIEWKMYTRDSEYAKLQIPNGTGISGLKFIVKGANLAWSHFVIQKIHIYKEFVNYGLAGERISNFTTLDDIRNIERINDGKYGQSAWRYLTDYSVPIADYYGYVWDTPISVNRVTMTVHQGMEQAPTAWRVEVSRDKGNSWAPVTSISDVQWTTSSSDSTMDESKDLDFVLQEDINGLRVWIDKANLTQGWNGYGIDELEVYHIRREWTGLSSNHAMSANKPLESELTLTELTYRERIQDGDRDTFSWRNLPSEIPTTEVTDYYTYFWPQGNTVSVNQVTMVVTKAQQQAPISWRIQITKDGKTWTPVASVSNVQWQSGDQQQVKNISFEQQDNVMGLRVYVDKVNSIWSGYAINEIEVYNNPVSLTGSSVALDGTIDINFFFKVDLSDAEKSHSATYACFSVPGEEEQRVVLHTLPAEANTDKGYKFPCKVSAKKMTDTITVRFYVEGKLCPGVFEYSVSEYARTIIQDNTNTYTEKAKQLAESMLHYGAYSQKYFDYNTNKLANEGIERLNVDNINPQQFTNLIGGNTKCLDGLGQIIGSNLVLESATTLKLYFQPEAGYTVYNLTFARTDGGRNEMLKTSTTVIKGETYICIPIANIAAHELSDALEITVFDSGGTKRGVLKYGTLTYGYNVLKSGSYHDALVDLVKALYHYNQMTIAYKQQ